MPPPRAAFATALGALRRWHRVCARRAAGTTASAAPPPPPPPPPSPPPSPVPAPELSDAQLRRVQAILRHDFGDRALLAQALTHRSVVNAATSRAAFFRARDLQRVEIVANNERLELLGDRVLALLVADALFARLPRADEGRLSQLSHRLVARRTLHRHCVALGLHAFLLDARALRAEDARRPAHTAPPARYGDCFEALLGALFLDAGYPAARRFYVHRVVPLWHHLLPDQPPDLCHKRALQEHLVRAGLPAPRLGTHLTYVTTDRHPSSALFTRAIRLFGRRVSHATAPNVQNADQTAARLLLHRLRRCNPNATTCFLIRLARTADDQYSLNKLHHVRATQLATSATSASCSDKQP